MRLPYNSVPGLGGPVIGVARRRGQLPGLTSTKRWASPHSMLTLVMPQVGLVDPLDAQEHVPRRPQSIVISR